MLRVNQHNADSLGKLRVSSQHVYGEGDFVGDALAGGLGLGPKFELFESVIGALAFLVMYIFMWKQSAIEMFFHHKNMLKDLAAFFSVLIRKANANVAILIDAALNFAHFGWAKALMFSKFMYFATIRYLGTAYDVAMIKGALTIPYHLNWFTTHNTRLTFGLPTSFTAAFARTVKRVFTPMFAVTIQVSRLHLKWLATIFTGEVNRLDNLAGAAMRIFVNAVTGVTTIFSVGVFWLDPKGFTTVLARQINRHVSPLFVYARSNHYTNPLVFTGIIIRGVA